MIFDCVKDPTAAVDETPNEIFARAGYEKGRIDGRRSVYEELRKFATAKINELDASKCMADEATGGEIFQQSSDREQRSKYIGYEEKQIQGKKDFD